ncbi:MAG: hypothetical protein JO197_06210 [Acidobacteria bacterium]|nr:hypothetical protein [Acidobacteriota bacterium]MBV9070653.1 hypothetical protein [Acidobacteriota bacterium]MBV9478160.1 hypothetical protein [Acidobacteriota bacterium]
MNINCSQLDDLLFDASPLAMETAARHANDCPACAEKLREWNELSTTAASLHATWDNDLLWPRIERALRDERRRSPLGRVRRYAAAAALLAVLGGPLYYALRVQVHETSFDNAILRSEAMDEVERAEHTHVAAIHRLERLAAPKLEEAESPLIVSYKEKLMLLDEAIAECQANIDRNRQNAHLRKQLLAMYSEKQQTLQDVLREDNHVSNQ